MYICVRIYKYKSIYKLIIEVREFAHWKLMFPLKKLDLTIQFNIYLLSTYYDPNTVDTGMEKVRFQLFIKELVKIFRK